MVIDVENDEVLSWSITIYKRGYIINKILTNKKWITDKSIGCQSVADVHVLHLI